MWSTVYAVIKIGLQYDSPLHFAGLRFIISGLIILPFTVKPSVFISMVVHHWRIILWVTLLQALANYILFYLGMDLVPGALGAVIVGSQPLFTAVVSNFMHREDKLNLKKTFAIIGGITGVVLISAGRQAFKFGTAAEIAGVLMIFGANIATATNNVLISVRSRGINPLVLNAVSLFTGGIIIYLSALVFEDVNYAPRPPDYWISLGWLAIVSSAAFSIWYMLLQRPHVKVSELNFWKFIIPVLGAILSWILVPGENPEWITVSGMIIIASTLLIFHLNGNRKKPDK
jgi:drug/metabolite transporter (DMT)-like permease